jgi:hypothetical protein
MALLKTISMRKFRIQLGIVAALIPLAPAGFAKDAGIQAIDSVLLMGKASIGTKAPPDWVPVRNPNNLGLCVAYVHKGRTFNDSPSIIYTRLVSAGSIEDMVSQSAEHLKKFSETFRLEKKKDYRSKKGVTFAVRYFLNGPNPNEFEAAGYLAYKGQFLIVVYSSRNRKDFDAHINSFFAALDSVIPYSTEANALSGACLVPKN